jgi:hypothetical protein
MTGETVRESLHSEINDFLAEKGYELIAKTTRTGIFREKKVGNQP